MYRLEHDIRLGKVNIAGFEDEENTCKNCGEPIRIGETLCHSCKNDLKEWWARRPLELLDNEDFLELLWEEYA